MVPSKWSSTLATPLSVAKKSKILQFSIQQGHDYAIKTTSLKALDKEVSIIICNFTSFSESNKASVTSECQCLKEWKKITSDNWTLETVKGAKIDVHDVKKLH